MSRKVLLSIKVMPEGVESNLEEIKEKIKQLENLEVKDIQEEPVAFGIKALKVVIMVEDKEKVADEIQEKINKISGVESADVESITLI